MNEYEAQQQRNVYQYLLGLVPATSERMAALDIGCGASRWCAILADAGFKTTGIDIQPELIFMSQTRRPDITFHCADIASFTTETSFALLSSVTVIQHNPLHDQKLIFQRLADLSATDAYFVMLENTHDHAAHVWSHSVDEWLQLAKEAGFKEVTIRKYDYNPMMSLLKKVKRRLATPVSVKNEQTINRMLLDASGDASGLNRIVKKLFNVCAFVANRFDRIIEPTLVRFQIRASSTHVGILFRYTKPSTAVREHNA